eukprot:1462230-Prymnesium_polylepis.1
MAVRRGSPTESQTLSARLLMQKLRPLALFVMPSMALEAEKSWPDAEKVEAITALSGLRSARGGGAGGGEGGGGSGGGSSGGGGEGGGCDGGSDGGKGGP